MGFTNQTGKVTVDSENKSTPKAEIEYPKFEVDVECSLEDTMAAILKQPLKVWDSETNSVKEVFVTEELTVLAEEGEEKAIQSGTYSLVQLLADGWNRLAYTAQVGIAKGKFNNSPEKTDSNMVKMLQAIIDNPETTPERREKAEKMLSVFKS